MNIIITAAYLRSYDLNVVVVDWGVGANTINYISARNQVGPVGNLIGQFLDNLHAANLVDFSRVALIGHSLGGIKTIYLLLVILNNFITHLFSSYFGACWKGGKTWTN